MAYLYSANQGDRILSGSSISLKNGDGAAAALRFYEDSDNGVLYTAFKAGNVTTSKTYTLPLTDGSDGEVLSTDGSATLSWAAAGSLSGLGSTDNALIRTNGTGGGTAQGSSILIDDSDNVSAVGTLGTTGALTIAAAGGLAGLGAGGNEFSITESSDDITVQTLISNKDMIFKVNDGGSATEVARFDGDVSSLLMASGKKISLGGAGVDLSGDGTDMTVASAGNINITSTVNEAASIYIRANAGTSEQVLIHSDQGTAAAAATEVDASIMLKSDAGGIGLYSALNAVNAISIEANGGTSENIRIHSNQGTSATEGAASIQLLSDVGGINIKSNLDDSAAILLTADGGTSAEIKVHNDQGTSDDSIYVISDAGGIKLEAGGEDGITMAGATTFQQGFTIGMPYYVTGAIYSAGWSDDQTQQGFLTASYTITDQDNLRFIPVSASTDGASSMTITLPTAADNAGRVITVKDVAGNCDDNVITIDGESSETVDGKLSITLQSPFASVSLISISGSSNSFKAAWYVF